MRAHTHTHTHTASTAASPTMHPAPTPGTYRGRSRELLSCCHSSHLGDDGCHIGGTIELDLGQAVLVGLHHTLDSCRGRENKAGPGHPTPSHLQLLPSHSSSSGLKLMAKSWDTWVETVGTSQLSPTCPDPHGSHLLGDVSLCLLGGVPCGKEDKGRERD
jgi:hypothetical protein